MIITGRSVWKGMKTLETFRSKVVTTLLFYKWLNFKYNCFTPCYPAIVHFITNFMQSNSIKALLTEELVSSSTRNFRLLPYELLLERLM